MSKSTKHSPSSLPSKTELLAFIRQQPGQVGTREIARAFSLKNVLRAELKRMLRELADEGEIETRHRKLHRRGTLPNTVLADVVVRDSDGDLLATP
ncbi:MAG TPA: ribonuclease R, partial [Gammaproteobacteria bacterium]|nr:ribonuclease R [Gammaproteobacteria bacterium]